MKQIILLRHGQSQWNLENRFTGWTDVPLSQLGKEEARRAGEKILAAGLQPEFYFTSVLKRAIHTLQIAAEAMNRDWVPVIKDWHLNERHYGALQGLNKAETAARYGEGQVREWRRSFDIQPPVLTPDDPRYPGFDSRYADLTDDELPLTESLKDTVSRVKSCWEEIIIPRIHNSSSILIVAHGNSLRALATMLLHKTATEVTEMEIPTGSPWVFDTDDRLNVTSTRYL